ncbi:hypothetical protein EVAR_38780_1 [Eumeta japonica]|uniref:Uncharacterized protein n=1 Tax=Eumeta variegata TaxID=151549 RepID=A0A4C1WIV3_EUMVA|nr:hypothetical protein EVAR_38780_1 [Eumeta japonica]
MYYSRSINRVVIARLYLSRFPSLSRASRLRISAHRSHHDQKASFRGKEPNCTVNLYLVPGALRFIVCKTTPPAGRERMYRSAGSRTSGLAAAGEQFSRRDTAMNVDLKNNSAFAVRA